jgi:hypothetical protein
MLKENEKEFSMNDELKDLTWVGFKDMCKRNREVPVFLLTQLFFVALIVFIFYTVKL